VQVTAGEEEGKKTFRISPAVWFFSRRRVNPRAASGGGAWNNAPPLFPRPENFLDTVPACRGLSL